MEMQEESIVLEEECVLNLMWRT